MRRRHGRVNRWLLLALAFLAVVMFWSLTRTIRPRRSRLYESKLAAAHLARQGFRAVRQYRDRLGLPIDSVNDPNRTGLIGLQYSGITFGRGDLSDALTTTNPDFAAALVEMLHAAEARPGDSIGISMDGTYPALNIALLAAAKTLGLTPVTCSALSAGMWGANTPGLTWLDIEALLRECGIIDVRSSITTLGAEADNGRGLSPEGRSVLAASANSAGVALLVPESLGAGVSAREELFRRCRLVVMVGRAVVNSGDPVARIPSRLLTRRTGRVPPNGLAGRLLDRGVKVLYLANPSEVAIDHHLPVAPVPPPEPGSGRLYFERRYSVVLAAAFALVLLCLLAFVVRYNVESYLGARQPRAEEEAV